MSAKEFRLSEDDLATVWVAAEAGDQNAVNDAWQALGIKFGFVYTTMTSQSVGDDRSITFWADIVDRPVDPAFEAWLIGYAEHQGVPHDKVIVWDYGDGDLANAFEAGRRVVTEGMAGWITPVASAEQIVRLNAYFDNFKPAASPLPGQTPDQTKAVLAEIERTLDQARQLFIELAGPILVECERERDPDAPESIGVLIAASHALALFAQSVLAGVVNTMDADPLMTMEVAGHA